jgi:hypothetical protein
VSAARAGGVSAQFRSDLLATTYKDYERAVDSSVNSFIVGTLPAGEDLVLGLNNDYAVGVDHTNWELPGNVWSKVVRLCSNIRQHTRADAP